MPIPRATYRFQFNEHFRLADALALVPYLSELGISHIYASPLLRARAHSTHGYDVCDFGKLNPELGTEDDLCELVSALRSRSMGLILDIVPNHMGIGGRQNRWWWDVLANGAASKFAYCFDIDWESPNPRLRGKVLAPVLSEPYDRVLERGEIHLAGEKGERVLQYFDNVFPIAAGSLKEPSNDALIEQINASPEALDKLIQRQHYLLSDWRSGDSELNYRRFFSITTLAGLRMEEGQVFNETHALIKRWFEAGWLDGLRVDHPDGLRDPEQYLRRLRGLAPRAWTVIEKILEPGESLPLAWPVAGTSGYDFLNRANGLFVDPDGNKPLTDFYADFTGEPTDYAAMVREKKLLVLRDQLAAEVSRLTRVLARVAAGEDRYRHLTPAQLGDAMMELAAGFPVYRTYVRPEQAELNETDVGCIKQAAAAARQQRPDLAGELFDLLGDLLLLRRRGSLEYDFVLRFQQLTGAAMAKGAEDTAFYCFNRLISQNEVGGDPGHFGLTVSAFHEACRDQQSRWPEAMLSTSTHDTKRSEDVRARLNLLSEIPETWGQAVRRWAAMNERHRQGGWPDRNAEYFFYQTLVGAWPLSLKRALAGMEKAAGEAKQHTSWTQRNEAYDTALRGFVTATLASMEFRKDLELFLSPLVEAGQVNSLAMTLLKLTAPGVPDIYQGSELWDHSLMDPDNRRPVDFTFRRCLLSDIQTLPLKNIWKYRHEGLPKLWLIQRVLALRARRPELFGGAGSYEPLTAQGAKAGHVIAFMRGGQAITIVPRLVLGLGNDWAGTTLELPPGKWRNVLADGDAAQGHAKLAVVLREFPVALLLREKNEE